MVYCKRIRYERDSEFYSWIGVVPTGVGAVSSDFILQFFIVGLKFKDLGYFKSSAVNLDRFGNSEFRTLFNLTLKKKEGYKFGNMEETISSVLGKNQRDNTLSFAGKVLVFILDTIEKNHCKKSIKTFDKNQ